MRNIPIQLVELIDEKLKTNGSAQLAAKEKDARELLIYAVEACVGEVEEKGKDNSGYFVELCQKTVDNNAGGEAWCMCFVQSMIAYVEQKLNVTSHIASSENCLEVWEKTPDSQIVKDFPARGAIVIWRSLAKSKKEYRPDGQGKRAYYYNGAGHTGFVIEYDATHWVRTMATIEGNTNEQGSSEGDGVYKKSNRNKDGVDGDKEVVGFLIPFQRKLIP